MYQSDVREFDAIPGQCTGKVHWRYVLWAGLSIVALGLMALAGLIILTLSTLPDVHQGRVPGDARPAGFKQLVRWNSCGATGEYCSDEIIFAQNDISFDDAIRPIASRYSDKGWRIKNFGPDVSSDGGTSMSKDDEPRDTKCISFARFNAAKFRRDLPGPDPAVIESRAKPYSVVIEVSAGGCG